MSQLITAPRSADEVLGQSRTDIDAAMRAAVDTLPASTRHIAGYHLGWWDTEGRPADADEPPVHAAIALLAAEAVGGTDALPAAVAMELAHHHALLHDDVMNRAETRRDRPAAWTEFEEDPAVEAGDALLTLAFGVLAQSRPHTVHMLNAAMLAVVDGLIIDVDCADRGEIDMADCLRTAAARTAVLLACAGAIGAVFGGGTADQVEHLYAFGEDAGLACAHVTDIRGLATDLRARRWSLPVVAAMTSGTPAGQELAALYRQDTPLSDTDLRFLTHLVEGAGGPEWSTKQADALLVRALKHLRAAEPHARAADELFAVARLITDR